MKQVPTLIVATLLAAACSDFAMEPADSPSELRVTPDTVLLLTGESTEFEVELLDADGEVYATIPAWVPPLWTPDRPDRVEVVDGVITPVVGGQTLMEAEVMGLTTEAVVRANPSSMALSTPLVYVVQSAQRTIGSVPLVAGREGLLRVVVTGDEENFYRPVVRATFYNGDVAVHVDTLQIEEEGLPTALDEGNLNLSYDAEVSGDVLQAGSSLVIEIDPDGVVPATPQTQLRIPASGTLDLGVREVPPFRLMMVPVHQTYFDLESRLTPETAERVTILTEEIFPFGDFQMELRESYTTDARLDTEDGWFQLLQEIEFLRDDDGNPHYYYGGFALPPGALALGIGYVGYPVSVGVDTQGDVIAHEVGHNLNLLHAPCGGPAGVDAAYPYGDGGTGVFGWQRTANRLKDPEGRFDLMSYCNPIWISDYHYEKVLAYRETSPYDAAFEPMAAVRATADQPTLVVQGGVYDGELVLSPALEWNGPVSVPRGGRYTLQGLDDAGAEIFSVALEPKRLDHGNHAQFLVALPAGMADPDRVARLRLTGPEGTVERGRSRIPTGRVPDVVIQRRQSQGTAGEVHAGRWDEAVYPLAVVRDRQTGRIRAMSRSGRISLPADVDPAGFEILLSDGVGTHSARVLER